MDKRLVSQNFSKYAQSYDTFSSVQFRCAEELCSIIRNSDQQFDDILEIGCGTGTYTEILNRIFPDSSILAIDISDEMLFRASSKIKSDRVSFLCQDADNISVEGKFDLITSNACFQWLNDFERAMVKYHSLLTDNGILCFSAYGPKTYTELASVLNSQYGKKNAISASKFVSYHKIIEILSRHFSGVEVSEKQYLEEYDTLIDLLRNIKYTGTRGEGLGKEFFLSKASLSDMQKAYKGLYDGIKATHDVCLCLARK